MKQHSPYTPYALTVPSILLPKDTSRLNQWAVIACDQYTQDREYWEAVKNHAQGAPSTLNIIFPEVYLEDDGRARRIENIKQTMKDYLGSPSPNSGVFAEPVNAFVYIERKTAYGRTRKGLMAAVDLDSYEWQPGSKALIRATEATIVDRIPPRMEIRRGAPIESPHIMLLVNDPSKSLIEAAGDRARKSDPLYQCELFPNSGSITGWAVRGEEQNAAIATALSRIAGENTAEDGSVFLFAVGDGNHSLATAKAVWEEYRKEASKTQSEADLVHHPMRYALVEIVNLYDDGLTFEPIHRVLFGKEAESLPQYLADTLGGTLTNVASEAELERLVSEKNTTRFGFVFSTGLRVLDTPDKALAVSRLQPALDRFMAEHSAVKIDFIHGSEEVFRLGKDDTADTLAILLPPVEKDSFFTTIASGGPLPRKSFSMGEASEKRYYLECRKLF